MPRGKYIRDVIPLIKQDRLCVICGKVYHSKVRAQQTCGRECGGILNARRLTGKRRKKIQRVCSLSQQERFQAIKLLYCLKTVAGKRPDLKPDLNYARLKEAWQAIRDIPLRIGGERHAEAV